MTIKERIRLYVRNNFLFGNDTGILDEGSLLDAGIVDSTGAMELVSFLESEFGLRVDDQDLVPENLDSIAAMAAFVMRRQAEEQQLAMAPLARAS
jgi:acyl carrier protein